MYDQQPEHENEGYTEVFAWGSNRQKQLGVGQRGAQPLFPVPKLQSFGIVIDKISCGHEHSGFIAHNGLVFMFGCNSEGQLGVGDQSLKASDNPLLVESLSMHQAISLSCGAFHTACVTDKNEAYGWGLGDKGSLGYGDHENSWFPVRMVAHPSHTASKALPVHIKGKSVSCGEDHTLVLDVSGKLYGCGSNEHGQLANGSKDSDCSLVLVTGINERVVQAAAGAQHSLILTESGRALASGLNNKGQLGDGTVHSTTVPVEVKAPGLKFKTLHASTFSAGLTDSGDLYLWGENPSFGESLTPTKEIKLSNIVSADIGTRFAAAVDENGAVYTWGVGEQGELGLGAYETTEEPEQVGQLEAKQATQISAGSNHVIALGQNVIPSSRPSPGPVSYNGSGLLPQMSQASHLAPPSLNQTGQGSTIRGSPSNSPSRKAPLRNFPPTQSGRLGLDRSSSPFQGGALGTSSRYYNADAPSNVEDLHSRLTAERIRRQSRGQEASAARERPLHDLLEENREQMRQRNDITRWQSKIADLESELDVSKRDNRNLLDQLKQLKEDRKIDSSQLHSMLKEYETKMALEIDSKHAMAKEKTKEIQSLHDHVTRLEGELATQRLQRQRIEEYYSDQIDKVNNSLHMAERQLGLTSQEADSLKGRNEADANRIGALTINVQRMNEKIAGLELENKHLIKKFMNEQELNAKLKEELVQESERANCHEAELNGVREALQGVNQQYDEHAGKTVVEIENLRAVVNDLTYNKNDLVNQINAAHQEKEDLYREVVSWKDLVNKLTEENTQLKLIIEDLEQKNKRFSETLNTHLYNRAAEFKARAINALKGSTSPFRARTPDISQYASPSHGLQTPNRVIRRPNPGSASTQPMPSAQRLNKLLQEDQQNRENEQNVRDLVKTDHDETKAMKEIEDKHQGAPRHGVTDFDYGNVMDRGQHGPNRDPRLVNSNYALIGNLDNMERGNPPNNYGQPPLINEPDNVDAEPTPESINRPPSVAQSMNPNYGRTPIDEEGPLGRSLSAEDLKESDPIKQTIKRNPHPQEGAPGSTSTTPLRVQREQPQGQYDSRHDPTKPPESGRNIGDPTYYRVDPSTRQIERNRELDNRFATAQDSAARLTEMLGVDSPIRKSVARHTMSSPTRRVPDPEQRGESPGHPLSAGVGLPYASYHPEAASPNVVGNPVASHVTAQMVRSTMQKVKAQLQQNKEANQNVSEGLVQYEKRMKEREYDQL